MATTQLIPMHINKGQTIAQSMAKRFDYGQNPDKTQDGELITSYECDYMTADAEFLLSKAQYKAITGREQKRDADVLCYQIRQSFLPGEITPEEANRVGYETAMRWTKGRHAFFVATHIDRHHIHTHIYYNSTALDCTRKFRDFRGSARALRRLSDRICIENELSIVKNPKMKSKGKYQHYGQWLMAQEGPLNFKQKLRLAIDAALGERPADFAAFLSLIEAAGYEVKQQRGAISFRSPGQERFTRLRASTLGEGYGQEDIEAVISGKRKLSGKPVSKVNLVIDIQSKLQGKGPAYERLAKIFNLKQMAAALAYLQDNSLYDYEQLAQKAEAVTESFHTISDKIKDTETALKVNGALRTTTVKYAKTHPVFEAYKAAKYSKRFLAEHEADIAVYRAAQADFGRLLGGTKLPKMNTLVEQSRKLATEKKSLYSDYQKAKKEMQEVTTAKANIDYLLGYAEPQKNKEQER